MTTEGTAPAAAVTSEHAAPGAAGRWWPLAAVCLATFMLLLDITVVNVALPSMQAQLHASFAGLQWVINAYAVSLAALQLTSGSLGDRLGRRHLFIAGLAVFTLASLTCGLAPDAAVLVAARAVQGAGGAAMFATSLALIGDNYAGRDRGTAFGVWGAVVAASVSVGPLLGGALATASWRWIFFINLPVAAVTIAIAALRLRSAPVAQARRIDWAGVVLFTAALVALVYALAEGSAAGWSSAEITGLLAGAAALLVTFVIAEARQQRPMLQLSLFRRPQFAGAQLASFALGASLYAMFLYLTLYLQDILGESALRAGAQLLAVSVPSLLAAPVAGKLAGRVPHRVLLAAALALTGAGLILMHGVSPVSGWAALLPGFLLAGIGSGAASPLLGSLAVAVVPPGQSGAGAGINNTFRQVGLATGIAALGAVFAASITSAISAGLPDVGRGQVSRLAAAVSSGGIRHALGHIPAAQRAHVAAVSAGAFASGLNTLLRITAAIALLGALACLILLRPSPPATPPVRTPAGARHD